MKETDSVSAGCQVAVAAAGSAFVCVCMGLATFGDSIGVPVGLAGWLLLAAGVAALARWLHLPLTDEDEKDAIPRLVRALKSPSPGDRISALRELRNLGKPGTLDLVVGRLKDPDAEVRLAAIATLASLGGDRAIGRLGRVAEHAAPDEAVRAVRALASLGGRTEPALAHVVATVGAPGQARAAAARTLCHSRDPKTVQVLTEALQGRNQDVREACAWALGRIGAPAEPALDTLTRLHELHGGSVYAEAIRRIGARLSGTPTELEAAAEPEGRGTELEAGALPRGRGTEPEAAPAPGARAKA
jgi:HEAT repeat protein